ncbi:hypothetical protein ACSQ67_023777 [Phaseolus vulgaris]
MLLHAPHTRAAPTDQLHLQPPNATVAGHNNTMKPGTPPHHNSRPKAPRPRSTPVAVDHCHTLRYRCHPSSSSA